MCVCVGVCACVCARSCVLISRGVGGSGMYYMIIVHARTLIIMLALCSSNVKLIATTVMTLPAFAISASVCECP